MLKEKYLGILQCPSCQGEFKLDFGLLKCAICSNEYDTSKIPVNLLPDEASSGVERRDSLDKFKSLFKKYPLLYEFLVTVFSPVYFRKSYQKHLVKRIESQDLLALNLGSGAQNLSGSILNIDFSAFENVDALADISCLPIKNSSVDVVFSLAVLEHVSNPQEAISEMRRILKSDGEVYCVFPFIQGFHASPNDFTRVTEEGIKVLFSDFKDLKIEKVGPTSSFLWITQEWIASLFSFGNRTLHNFILIFLMLLTWPIKFVDVLLQNNLIINNISSAIAISAKKK